jgi:hypothetical protein
VPECGASCSGDLLVLNVFQRSVEDPDDIMTLFMDIRTKKNLKTGRVGSDLDWTP